MLQSSGRDGDPDHLTANATYELPDGPDPHRVYGPFIRRIADYPTVDEIRRRAE